MNIPQTPGPNEKLHHSTLSLSPLGRVSEILQTFMLAFNLVYMQASKQANML